MHEHKSNEKKRVASKGISDAKSITGNNHTFCDKNTQEYLAVNRWALFRRLEMSYTSLLTWQCAAGNLPPVHDVHSARRRASTHFRARPTYCVVAKKCRSISLYVLELVYLPSRVNAARD